MESAGTPAPHALLYSTDHAQRRCAADPEDPPSVITRRRFLGTSSLGAVSLTVRRRAAHAPLPDLKRTDLLLPHLPAELDGLTVAQVADVHAGPYMPVRRMRRIRDLVAALPADLIVFTGDQLDRRPSDAGVFVDGFRGLEAPLGVYGILGNHDLMVGRDLAVGALEMAGITPLVNRSVELEHRGARFALVGVDDLQASGSGPDFTLLGRHRDVFRICLCHQPQGWPAAELAGAQLTLSGHTHGGQIALTRRHLNVARLGTRFIAGPYRREDAFLYVSRGIGVGALPLRVGAPPEVDLLVLRSEAAGAGARAA